EERRGGRRRGEEERGGGRRRGGEVGGEERRRGGEKKRGGVEGMIEIENPNRIVQKSKKVTQIEMDEPKTLSRREREELEKQKAKERYMKMHLAGKTDQAKADLARLAIVRKQREDAAKKKEEEKKRAAAGKAAK
uniref:Casein kinase substrate phosphoprotein PP28 domain-containing protein n=1 Tax=Gadus morhua TaxID=8049 RepID=A0A8C5A0W9_GADMO